MPSDNIEYLINELNSATESIDTTELKGDIEVMFSKTLDVAKNVAMEGGYDGKIKSAEKIYNEVKLINTSSADFDMEKYESLNLPILEHYSLNVKALFDYTLSEVKKDIPHSEDENFDADSVISTALGKAIKQCGIGDKKSASFEDFKSLYKKAVFGSKKFLHPNTTQMMKNINKCGFALGAIKHSLLSSHLNNIKRYRSEMYKTLKSVRNTVSYKEYTKAINKALDLTSDIYHYMIQVYEEYINYCIEVFEKIKKINNEINKSSLYESVTDVANIISPINKSFKNVINSSLNEEVTISESLSTFEQDINLKANDLCADNKIVLEYFLRTIGPTLLRIKSNTIQNKEIRMFETENIDLESEWFMNSLNFDNNIKYLNEIIEHYNEKEYDAQEIIQNLFPKAEFIPDSFDLNILIQNLYKTICGDRVTMIPDIGIISKNAISIPNFLGRVDSHIHIVSELIEKSIDSVRTDGEERPTNQLAINNIKNTLIVYLAILLSIFKFLSILEKSVLNSVTAISEFDETENPI